MKRILAPLGILAILLAIAPAWAAVPGMTTTSGKVVSVDASAQTLVVSVQDKSGASHPMTFSLAPDSKIVKASQAITLSQIQAGDRVTVTFKSDGGKNVVVNVGVESQG